MIAGLRTQLESSRKQLLEAIQGFTQEKSHVRPDDESWCAAEVLRHLLGSEHRMRERVRQALGQRSTLPPVPSEAERRAEAETGRRATMDDLVDDLLKSRRETLVVIEALRPEDLSRPASHPEFGTVTVERVLQRIAEHERHHAEQISDIS